MMAALLAAALKAKGKSDITVESAGTSAVLGEPASAGASACMAARGLDLAGHRSRPLHSLDLSPFDLVLCMTSTHAATLRNHGVPATKLTVIDAEHGGIPDPFGGDQAQYEACARILECAAYDFAAKL
jgi:protein-tyrosine phosphatase